MAACSPAAALFAAVLLLPVGAAGQSVPLYVVDLDVTADEPLDLERPLRVRLYSDAPADLAGRLGGVVSVAADHLVLDATADAVLGRAAPPGPPAPTFVVDYESEPIAALRAAAAAQYGSAPQIADLIAVVRATVAPTQARSFDVASQVATHKKGDCTEHAVLLAALARSFGVPARVAVGILIARADDQLGAFGHAWVEVYREGGWSLADATPLEGGEALAYVPEGLLVDEGPGYTFGLLSLLATGVLRIEVVGNAPPTPHG